MISADKLKQDFGTEIAVIVLVCRVFVGTAADDELSVFISENNIDWQQVYTIARIHQLRPVAFKVLYKFHIPKDIKDKLQANCTHIAMHNLEHARELTRIFETLNNSGVTAIPYKGSVFCVEYYKDLGLREFSDIDFLINLDLKDLSTIKKSFEQAGYIDKSNVPEEFKATLFRYTREYYFDKYEEGKRQFHTEFHWATASQVFDFPTPLPNSLLFRDLKESNICGKQVKVLSDTHHFIAMATHHGLNQRWGLIKYMMDFAMIVKNGKDLNWQEITTISKKYGFNKAVNIGLYIADELLGIKPAVTYKAPADAHAYLIELLDSLNKSRKDTSSVLLLNLKIKDNLGDKLKMIYKYISYSATPSILDYKFLKLPKGLYFLYLFVKPIRMLASSSKKD